MSRISKNDRNGAEMAALNASRELTVIIEEQEEVAFKQEEQKAELTAETSFFAADVAESPAAPKSRQRARRYADGLTAPQRGQSTGTQPGLRGIDFPKDRLGQSATGRPGIRDAQLAPYLRELQAELPRLAHQDDRSLLEVGTDKPALLDTVPLPSLRRIYAALRKDFPESALTKQLKGAWILSIERKIYASAQKLEALERAVRELNRGVMEADAFYQLWDRHTETLRHISSAQRNEASAGAKMGLGEVFFHTECLSLLDEHALEIALAKHKHRVPDEAALRRLAERLAQVAQFASMQARAELAKTA